MKTCGLDVHKDTIFCAIYDGKDSKVEKFGLIYARLATNVRPHQAAFGGRGGDIFVEKMEWEKKSGHSLSTNGRKRSAKGAHSDKIFAPEPVYIEGIVDRRWQQTVDLLTGEFRLFEADRREELLVAMGAKAGRLKAPLVYQGNDVYALCHVVKILVEADAWGGGSHVEVCRRLATCIAKTDGSRIQGEAIRTSIPKDPRKRRSLSSTYASLRTLWNVE